MQDASVEFGHIVVENHPQGGGRVGGDFPVGMAYFTSNTGYLKQMLEGEFNRKSGPRCLHTLTPTVLCRITSR